MFKCASLGLVMLSAVGCQASAGVNARASTSGDTGANAQFSSQAPVRSAATSGYAAPGALDGTESQPNATAPTMLGARSGLSLTSTKTATCQCLAVAVGQPEDNRFRWEGAKPTTDTTSQLVVGMSSSGLDCPRAAKDALGASYHGYEVQGSNVVVEVETARLGRPIVEGAVLPKPASGGKVVVRAVESTSPYGRSLDGSSPECVVWTAP